MVDIKKLEPVGGTISVVNVPVSMLTASNMPMRDYFAAKAMAALYTSQYEYEFTGAAREPEFETLMNELAQDAYQMADAMLAAREQK